MTNFATIAPTPKPQFDGIAGIPLVGGKLYTYAAGTTAPKATYSDANGTVPQANPIVLNARGEPASAVFWRGSYYVELFDALGNLIYSVDNYQPGVNQNELLDAVGAGLVGFNPVTVYPLSTVGRWLTDFALSAGSSFIGFIQSGIQTVVRTVQSKLREVPSLADFAGANDTERFNNAKLNGTKWLYIPSGVHTITGWSVAEADTLANLEFAPGAQLLVTAALNAIGLDIQKSTFNVYGECNVKSTGLVGDGLNTIGIRCGDPAIVGKAYIHFEGVRVENFSKRGFVFYQPVYVGIQQFVGLSCTYGLSVEPALGIGGSTIEIGHSYITGCTRGINLESASWVTLYAPIVEYCGNAVSTDGALHFKSCGSVTVIDRYGEANYRNMVKDDSLVTFVNGSMFAAAAADVISYTGTAFVDRGASQLNSKSLNIRRINYDTIDNEDLVVGSNLTVPKTGGSVVFGTETIDMYSGVLVSGVWTAVRVIPAAEQAAVLNNNLKTFYEYVAYAGFADLSTGFDAGTIMNGVMRSYSGALPAWLRLNVTTIEMNVTNASYGLNYKIELRRRFPGA